MIPLQTRSGQIGAACKHGRAFSSRWKSGTKERRGVLELCSSLLDDGGGHYEEVPVNETDEVGKRIMEGEATKEEQLS